MSRFLFLILAMAAVVWMMVPAVHDQGTEIGFAAGDPDPNVYKTTYLFGWPLTWMTWERARNEAAGYRESGVTAFGPFNFLTHALAITAPLLLHVRSRRGSASGPVTP